MEDIYKLEHSQKYLDVIEVRYGDSDTTVEHLMDDCTLTIGHQLKGDILAALELLKNALDILDANQITTIGARVHYENRKFLKINLSR